MSRITRFLSPILLSLSLVYPALLAVADPPLGTARVDFLDVGQGDAVLIRSPEGKTALVDAGASKNILNLLRDEGVTAIDMVVVSHHHTDHYGGMDDVVREYRPTVFLAFDGGQTSPTYLKLLKLVEKEDIAAIAPAERPRKIELGSVMLTVFPQPPEDTDDENDNSVGLRVQHGAASVLLTGDSQDRERLYWRANAASLAKNCDVLKLAHHGSRNGADGDWLDLVKPKLAVVSCGLNNSYGHPHPETLALLQDRGIPLRRTDQEGTIRVVSDGTHFTLAAPATPGRGSSDDADLVEAPVVDSPAEVPAVEDLPDRVERIDLNLATEEELKSLPGIGPALAMRIIAARPYRSVNDLIEVRGIGEKRLALLRPLVKVRP